MGQFRGNASVDTSVDAARTSACATKTATGTRTLSAGIIYPASVIALFVLLFLRRPDALLTPQFFAEDGRIFFHDQFLFGSLEALLIPYAGYLLFVPRLVAMFASLFPVSVEPAIYNGAALLVGALSCAIFCLPFFRSVVRSDLLRFTVCVVAVAGLDSAEIVGTITQIQWYLQFAGIFLFFYSARRDAQPNLIRDILLALVLLVIALSVPMLILLMPFVLWALWRVPGTGKLPAAAILLGVVIQLGFYAAAGFSRGQVSVFSYSHLIGPTAVYLAFRAVLSALAGRQQALELSEQKAFLTALIVGIVVVCWLGWLWWKSKAPARRTILLCLYLSVSSAFLAVGARNLSRSPITFGGERYFYLSACCTILLVAISLELIPGRNWTKAVALLLLFAIGLRRNFSVPAYADLNWPFYAERITGWAEMYHAGANSSALTVPINPHGWIFVLEGDVLTNGGFENSVRPNPWLVLGDIGLDVTRGFHHSGKASLIMSGTEGEARQLVRGLKPGATYRVEAMLLMPCLQGLAGSLLVDDGLDKVLAIQEAQGPIATAGTAEERKQACASWRKMAVEFKATRTRRALIRLHYHGNPTRESILWDDVQLQALH